MRTLFVAFLILATGVIAYGQTPAPVSKLNSDLKIHDAMWIAYGGDVYNGGWGGEGMSNSSTGPNLTGIVPIGTSGNPYSYDSSSTVPAELRHPNRKRRPVDTHPRVLLQNTGTKTIKAFDLDFVFLDPQTTVEFLRYRFHAKRTLKAGKVREFSQDVFQKVGDKRGNYTPGKPSIDLLLRTKDSVQKVRVQRIEYADGSVWERP
ncbi:MAG: hypothetical protein QOK48_1493 [Blastocatellia bacterium]|jgi:hypothetical protein|nr:hypothetical protein [Blastocatellia bacterium]